MSYTFQSTLYGTSRQAHLAVAEEWLSAGSRASAALVCMHEFGYCRAGWNGRDAILEALASYTDAELAAECAKGWGMDETEWFSETELAEAFCEVRLDPAAHFIGWDAE